MDIQFPLKPAEVRLILEQARSEGLVRLEPGQQVEAMALSRNDNGLVRLQMAGREVIAQCAIQTQPGERLLLTVVKTGERPELRLASSHTVPAAVQTQLDALRITLPRQQPLGEALARLQVQIENLQTPLPTAVRKAAQAVLRLLTDHPESPDAARLKTLIQSGGLFWEAHLTTTGLPPDPDLKAALLTLLSLSRSARTPEEDGHALRALNQSAEAALARVRYHQLASLPSDDGAKAVWSLDIPLRVAGQTQTFECRIEEEEEGQGKGKGGRGGFNADLAFDFPTLGPSYARVTVRAGQVGVVFWAERLTTVALIYDHLEQLAAQLRAVGLEVSGLQAYQGKPPRPASSPPRIPRLLDEKA